MSGAKKFAPFLCAPPAEPAGAAFSPSEGLFHLVLRGTQKTYQSAALRVHGHGLAFWVKNQFSAVGGAPVFIKIENG